MEVVVTDNENSEFQIQNRRIERVCSCIRVFTRHLFIRKGMVIIQTEIDTQNELKRNLNWIQLMAIGIGCTIGAGIFVLGGEAAAKYCGPSVILAFLLTGIVAILSAFSFAELGGIMSHAGSVYTYTYTALGEYAAWFVGWNSGLLYLFAILTVTVSWSKNFLLFISLVFQYNSTNVVLEAPVKWDEEAERFHGTGYGINIPAIAVNIAITIVLFVGIRPTAMVNLILVITKVIILLLFIFACCGYINRKNYDPFIPSNKGSLSEFGVTGLLKASTHVFFAYVGFDVISTVAQESKSPAKTVPIATIGTTIITLLLYIGISTVMVGLVPYSKLGTANPLADVIHATPLGVWLQIVMILGALAGLTSVALTTMLAQTRIFYAMAHDGLLPPIFAKVHSKTRTPWISILLSGIFCSILSGILPVDILGETTSIGALVTYIFVHIVVIVTRYKHDNIPRIFKIPLGNWLLPGTGCLLCMLLLSSVTKATAYRFLAWTILGQVLYFSYGFRHSKQLLRVQQKFGVSTENLMSSEAVNTMLEMREVSTMDPTDENNENRF